LVVAERAALDAASAAFFLGELFQSNQITGRLLLYVFDQGDFVDYADYSGVDGRVGAADGGHCGEAFGGKQDALANTRVYRVERDDRFSAIGAVEIQRLHEQDFAGVVRRIFLSSHYVTDDACD